MIQYKLQHLKYDIWNLIIYLAIKTNEQPYLQFDRRVVITSGNNRDRIQILLYQCYYIFLPFFLLLVLNVFSPYLKIIYMDKGLFPQCSFSLILSILCMADNYISKIRILSCQSLNKVSKFLVSIFRINFQLPE